MVLKDYPLRSQNFCWVPILGLATLSLRRSDQQQELTNIQALESGHASQGCQNATQRVNKNAKWRAQKQIQMYKK